MGGWWGGGGGWGGVAFIMRLTGADVFVSQISSIRIFGRVMLHAWMR